MPWKILNPDELDRTGEQLFVAASPVTAGGRYHLLADGTVAHENDAGTWQVSMHDADALRRPGAVHTCMTAETRVSDRS